jgi:hypothetical protein
MKSPVLSRFALPYAAVLLTAVGVTGVFADDHDKKTDVTIDQPVEVPGGVVLQPGMYMFKLLDATANRHIVQISSEDGKKTFAVVMTAAARRTEPASKTILTFYEMPTGTPQAVRKWFWPGDLDGQEFLYPHDRASQISKLTNENVPEAPEGQPLIDNSASASAQTTTDTTASPAAAATPEVVSQADQPATLPAPVETAQVQAPAPPAVADPIPAAAPIAAPAAVQAEPTPSANQVVAQNTTPPSSNDDSSLPQTASELPLITLAGFAGIAGALTLRRLRA